MTGLPESPVGFPVAFPSIITLDSRMWSLLFTSEKLLQFIHSSLQSSPRKPGQHLHSSAVTERYATL